MYAVYTQVILPETDTESLPSTEFKAKEWGEEQGGQEEEKELAGWGTDRCKTLLKRECQRIAMLTRVLASRLIQLLLKRKDSGHSYGPRRPQRLNC